MGRLHANRPELIYLLLFYLAYVVAGGLARKMQIIPGHTTAFWPAAGIYLATLLTSRRETWPWWAVAGCLAEMTCNVLWFRNSIPAALGFYVANALEALTAAVLLLRFGATPFRLETPRELAAYIVLGAGVAPMVGATVGCATHVIFGTKSFTSAWILWWLGDASGLLVSGPFALAAIQLWRERYEISAIRIVEGIAAAVILIGVTVLAFKGYLPTAYVTLPPLLWVALRFQLKGAAIAVASLALLAATFTVAGQGEFTGQPELMKQRVIMLKTFLAVAAISALSVAVLSELRLRAMRALQSMNTELEARVAERTAQLQSAEEITRTSEEKLRFALRGANAGAWERGLSLDRGSWSPECLAINGLPPSDRGPTLEEWANLIHPDDRQRVLETIEQAYAKGRRELELEYRILHGTLGERWISNRFRIEHDSSGKPVRQGGINIDISDRKRAEEHTRLLMREVNHRSKNVLSVVQAIVRQTSARDQRELTEKILQRIQGVAANQDLLVRNQWRGVPLDELIRAQLVHFADLINRRIVLDGPALTVTTEAAQTIGLAVHELATNAGKYGALSNGQGRIEVVWKIEARRGADRFVLTWRESGGPPVRKPDKKGFGTTLTTTMAEMSLAAVVTVSYKTTGLVWSLECDVARITEECRPNSGPTQPPASTMSSASGQSVLVVEDEPLLAVELADRLRKAGYTVLGPAPSVDAALALLKHTPCDVAVLDVNLGRETSEPVARHLRQAGKPFIVVSGHPPEQRPEALRSAPFVAKPVPPGRLEARLRSLIHGERQWM